MFERLFLNGENAAGGWIIQGPSNSTMYLYGVVADTNKNVYTVGGLNGDPHLVKFNSQGVLQWQKALTGTGSNENFSAVDVDPSGNVYCFGDISTSTAGGSDALIVKYDSAGTLQWQRRLGGTGLETLESGCVDASGNAYYAGWGNTQTAGNADFHVGKYNTSGTIQWQRRFGGSQFETCYASALDSTNNLYAAGRGNTQTAGVEDALLVKYNSTGTLQWQRRLGGTESDGWNGVGVDSSDNVYVTGYTTVSAANRNLIAKYNSAGTLQWQRRFDGLGYQGVAGRADSSGNVYISAGDTSYGTGGGWFSKLDSSGNLLFARGLLNGGTVIRSFHADNSGFIYVAGTYSTSTGGFVAKLPSDGSGLGTYGSWTYSSQSWTAVTTTLTGATPTLTTATTTLTGAASALTSSTSTVSYSRNDL